MNDCKHEHTTINRNVGYDIDEEGSEDQHLESCSDCGAQRFICDHSKHGVSRGTWSCKHREWGDCDKCAREKAEAEVARLTEALKALAESPIPPADGQRDTWWQARLYRVQGLARAALKEATP
ncbi:MAG: hypothetical protein ABIL09_01105 [Gemmatimonadota bacterium]